MITGIILAAGFSKRMGTNKLLIEIDGISIIQRVIEVAIQSNLDEIILVYREEQIKLIADKYKIRSIYNENAHKGQSESLKLGVSYASLDSDYMFLMADQPFLTSDILNRLIDEYKKSDKSILVPYYNGNKGTPTIFSYKYKSEIMLIEGDKGGRDIIKSNIEEVNDFYIDDEICGYDLDSMEDIKKIYPDLKLYK